jgi:hypothetical protein
MTQIFKVIYEVLPRNEYSNVYTSSALLHSVSKNFHLFYSEDPKVQALQYLLTQPLQVLAI